MTLALGPMIPRMGTFIPIAASYFLNGHSYIEQQLRRQAIGFRKDPGRGPLWQMVAGAAAPRSVVILEVIE